MNKNLITGIIISISVLCQLKSFCQAAPDSLNPYFELINLNNAIYSANHLSVQARYVYEESFVTHIQRDTILGSYKINGEQFYATLDSTEIIQNGFYNATIYHDMKTMIVSKPVHMNKNFFQVDILDTMFQKMYVDTMTLTDSGSLRVFSIQFKTFSPYVQYEIVYDKTTMQTSYVKYKIRKGIPAQISSMLLPAFPSPNEFIQVKVDFYNSQVGSFTDSVFNTDAFFTRTSGVLKPTGIYVDYELFDQSDK